MVIQHWLLLVSCWVYPNRSLVKATQTVRSYVPMLATAIAGLLDIAVPIKQIQNCLTAGCRMNPRRKTPNAYQLLRDLTLDPLPGGAQLDAYWGDAEGMQTIRNFAGNVAWTLARLKGS